MKSIVPEGMQGTYDDSHFSPAVVDGDRVYLAGIIGTDAEGKVPVDPRTQFRCAFEGVKCVLEAAGSSLGEILEMTTYHVDLHEHLSTFFAVKDEFLAEPYPAWTAIGVSALARRRGLVEIRVVAALRDSR